MRRHLCFMAGIYQAAILQGIPSLDQTPNDHALGETGLLLWFPVTVKLPKTLEMGASPPCTISVCWKTLPEQKSIDMQRLSTGDSSRNCRKVSESDVHCLASVCDCKGRRVPLKFYLICLGNREGSLWLCPVSAVWSLLGYNYYGRVYWLS